MSEASKLFYSSLASALRSASESDWATLARPNQLPPPGDWWRVWLLLAGRGFGKTRTICEFVRAEVERGAAKRVALVSATSADCRDVLVEGESGILAISPKWNRPAYEPTKRRLTWPNGAIATLFSADEPERLRGPQHDLAVCDELAAWRYPEAFDMLLLGLRLGKNPRVAIATTPRPTQAVRDLVAREGKDVVLTRGSTLENSANLAPAYIEQIVTRYRGTRLERQEIRGEVLDDTPGALWNRDNLEQTRVANGPALQRIVVAIDPAGSTDANADITGIVVAGLGQDGEGYVLEDLSGRYAPVEWARRAIGAYHVWKADRIVCETNYGGAMVAATIASVDPAVAVKEITSSRGKVLRAEPIATLFEQRRAHIVGSLPELEDQACRFTSDWLRDRDGSPDRVDALVFSLTELMLGQPFGRYFREAALLVNGSPIGLPRRPDYVYAVATASIGDSPRVAVIYLAVTSDAPALHPPVVILDWDLQVVDGGLFETWLPTVFQRLEALANECEARYRTEGAAAGLFVDSTTGIGGALKSECASHGCLVHDVNEIFDLPTDIFQRVNLVESRIHGGREVKVATVAHERILAHQGVTRNHFLHQFLGFRPGAENLETGLLDALCIGILVSGPAESQRRKRR